MKAYIQHIASMPTQDMHGTSAESSVTSNTFKMVDPDFSKAISSSELRRMSRLVRIGMYTASTCLQEVAVTAVDAIIIGTGLGGFECFEKFEESIIRNEEETLSPTPFIQSLHNAVSGQIALKLQCYGYNMTYVHRGFSFESALLDALMIFAERPDVENILVGGLDELTTNYIRMLQEASDVRKEASEAFVEKTCFEGVVLGEGCTMLLLSSQRRRESVAAVYGMKMLFNPKSETLKQQIQTLLAENKINLNEIGAVLLGNCGDVALDQKLQCVEESLFTTHRKIYFKNYCGEYPTASAFGVALAVKLLQNSSSGLQKEDTVSALKYVLLVNHYHNTNYSIILLANAQ